MSELKVYLNGKMISESEAHISISDVGFLHGGSVFTTLAAHNGRPFRLDRHLSRLLATVDLLDLRSDADADTLTAAVADVLAANDLKRARLRITLTPGDLRTARPTTLVTAAPLPDYPSEWYSEGITVVVTSFRQWPGDPTFGNKTGCYFPRILARREAQSKGATEALWFTATKRLSEGCFTNVFLVIDGVLRTPPRDTPVLPGVTREAVLELARELEIPCNDADELLVDDMLGAEEMFLTASTMGIVPVTRVERHQVGDGTVGAVTKKVTEAYRDLVERETTCESPK